VAVYADKGTGRSIKDVLRVLSASGKFTVEKLKAKDIADGKLADYDVLIHPGGSGGKQGRTLGKTGREKVRTFVKSGRGYVGFCAGAYLATNDYSWSLNLLDAKVVDKKHWARGYGNVELRLSSRGKELLGTSDNAVVVYYHQGPLLAPNDDPKIADYQLLAVFHSEIAKKGAPKGVMKGTTAIAAGRFGDGRVFCFSPHPEKTKGLETFVVRSVLWAAGRLQK